MILVFGSSGQVASELRALLPDARFLDRAAADLTQPDICAQLIADIKPNAVINAAAYTAVDKAEDDESTAALVNGATPTAMAKICASLDIPFVHISTDYVFDGAGDTPFETGHTTAPLGAYGRTKLQGETGVCAAGGRYAILRTSWVFSAQGNNFLKTMLRLGTERDALSIVADQIGGPTPANAIAKACIAIAEQLGNDADKSGTYHFSGAPNVSWADFARDIFERANLDCAVTDIPSSAYPTPAKRPHNSRLDCSETQAAFGIKRPEWRDAVKTILTDLEATP